MTRCLAAVMLVSACAQPARPEGGGQPSAKTAEVSAPAATPPSSEALAAEGAGEHAGCIYAGTAEDKEPACPGGGAGVEPDPPTQATGHFGAPFTLGQATPLGEAIEKGVGAEPILIAGTVDAVCQRKGCWMVVKDGASFARVLMKDHGFAVPTDSRGKQARVQGVLATRQFSEAQARHLESDRGGDPTKVSGERQEYVLTATGIEIADS